MLFLNRPWQVYFQICYVVFLGHLMLAWVIDIDHWRHVYLLLGMIWGCILLEKKHQKVRKFARKQAIQSKPDRNHGGSMVPAE